MKGRIVGYIQKDGGRVKQFFSRRAIIYGGPMLADDITEAEITDLLNDCKKQLKRKVIFIETRNYCDYSKYKVSFNKCGWTYQPHFDVINSCIDWEQVESKIGKHRKKYVRLSLRDGAEIVDSPTIYQVREFYAILSKLYKTKVKMPLWPVSFFEKLYFSPFGHFFLVKYAGQIIGGSACVLQQSECVYEWFACGEDGVFKNIHPSSLVKYAGLQYAATNGYSCFDMMGAGNPNDGGYGVRDFKLEFGGELVEYGRFKYILNRPLYSLGSLCVRLLKMR